MPRHAVQGYRPLCAFAAPAEDHFHGGDRVLRIVFPILFLLMPTAACGGQTQMQKHDMKVGGCVTDTIPLGLDMPKVDPGRIPERITIKAVHDAGRATFMRAARELAEILHASGVAVFGRSELIHVTEGACWPPWMITFEVDLQGAREGRGGEEGRPRIVDRRPRCVGDASRRLREILRQRGKGIERPLDGLVRRREPGR